MREKEINLAISSTIRQLALLSDSALYQLKQADILNEQIQDNSFSLNPVDKAIPACWKQLSNLYYQQAQRLYKIEIEYELGYSLTDEEFYTLYCPDLDKYFLDINYG